MAKKVKNAFLSAALYGEVIKMTGKTPEVRSDKRKPKERKERKRERKKRERERKRERKERRREIKDRN